MKYTGDYFSSSRNKVWPNRCLKIGGNNKVLVLHYFK